MEKNKTGKYLKYAIGEIVLVVIGILIALSINNWNEVRKMQLQEQDFLQGLEIEFKINHDRLVKVMQTSQQSIENANELMTYFNQDISEIKEVKFDSMLYNFQDVWTFNPRKGLLNSIIASGKINLISNVELKNQLASFEDLVNDVQEELDAISELNARYNATIDEYINFGRQHIIGYKIFVNAGFKSDYNRFFKDIRVYNLINNITTWRFDAKEEEIEQLQSIDRILVLINKELNYD
tara:strand:+ start:79597 stop:80310 length:714 start_codon:yes stop_codon:yes gene_type:complete